MFNIIQCPYLKLYVMLSSLKVSSYSFPCKVQDTKKHSHVHVVINNLIIYFNRGISNSVVKSLVQKQH